MADDALFLAALSGDLTQLRKYLPTHASARNCDGYTPLSLAVSAGHEEAVRLLLREGADVNSADNRGVTALMHAAMHGYAGLVHTLLLHGARPLDEQHDGKNALGLAALYGRPAALGAFFRSDTALVEQRDSHGRAALHWAVASKHTPTVKYMLGCWGADVTLVDHDGNTPLHLVESHVEISILIYHGTATRPSLTACNGSGHTPAQAAAALGALSTAEALEPTEDGQLALSSWLHDPTHLHQRLFAFLQDSPLRAPPSAAPPSSWVCRATWTHLLTASVPVMPVVLIICGAPSLTALLGLMLGSLLACIAALGVRSGPTCKDCAMARGYRIVDGPRVAHQAPLLMGCVLAAGLVHMVALVPHASGAVIVPAYGTLIALAGFWAQWGRLLWLDPGFVPGGDLNDARAYWEAVERMPPAHSSPDGFCDKSELRIPTRAGYSKLSLGMVRAFDHDCPWVERTIGAGNHHIFVLMLMCGEAAILMWMATLYCIVRQQSRLGQPSLLDAFADGVDDARAAFGMHAKLALWGLPLMVILFWALTPLLLFHVGLLCSNVTTREHVHWLRAQHHRQSACPMPGSADWKLYAPHDRGWITNTLSFFRGLRDTSTVGRSRGHLSNGAKTRGPDGDESDTELSDIYVQKPLHSADA